MYVTHSGVGAQCGLGAKHRCLVVEVVGWPKADGGRYSSYGLRDKCLLVEMKYAELVSDKVQASKEKGLERLKDGRNPHPNRWERGKLQQAEANRIA